MQRLRSKLLYKTTVIEIMLKGNKKQIEATILMSHFK